MGRYLESLHEEIREYFSILSPEFPDWLTEYIDTPAMRRIGGISMNCGTDYSACFHPRYWYSNLDHSVGTALILWHFTKDKRQTLAGLFHDIATPAFKHCIDFMNGDAERQESTEARTGEMIRSSDRIMALLKRDGIRPEEVDDYKRYPLADNETPKLSADRFEYAFSGGLAFFRVWEPERIRRVYENVTVAENEEGLPEFTFRDKAVCEEYVCTLSRLWPLWISDKDRTVMQFLADLCGSMCAAGCLSADELYRLSEAQVIERFRTCSDRYLAGRFAAFCKADRVYTSDCFVPGKYCVRVTAKRRYVVPLVLSGEGAVRIDRISRPAREAVEEYLATPAGGRYTGFDFEFAPYRIQEKAEEKSGGAALRSPGSPCR